MVIMCKFTLVLFILYFIFLFFIFTYLDTEGREWMIVVMCKEIKTNLKNQEKNEKLIFD